MNGVIATPTTALAIDAQPAKRAVLIIRQRYMVESQAAHNGTYAPPGGRPYCRIWAVEMEHTVLPRLVTHDSGK